MLQGQNMLTWTEGETLILTLPGSWLPFRKEVPL